MDETRGKMEATTRESSNPLNLLQDKVEERARMVAEKVKTYARANPRTVFGFTLLGGVIIGLTLSAMLPRTIHIKIEDKRKA